MLGKIMSEVPKVVAAVTACANAVVCQLAKSALDPDTRLYLMALAILLIIIMMSSFATVAKNFIAMMKSETETASIIA